MRACSQAKGKLNSFHFFFLRSPPSLNIHMEILQTDLQLYITSKIIVLENQFGATFSFTDVLILLGEV